MKLNESGIDLVKDCEGLSLKAYPDPATGKSPWTIGYGHTGREVTPGLVWTKEHCEDILILDLGKVSTQLQTYITTDLNDNQFNAIISFTYNVGIRNFATSTLLKLINEGNLAQASLEFPKWDYAAGKEMQGILNRRLKEQKLFNA